MSLRLEDVSVDLGGRRVVDHVTLDAPTGTVVGLLGPNGSGKSSLLRTVFRVHRPATGRVLLDGDDLLALPPREAARRVAVLGQSTPVEFDATVAEVVMIGRHPHLTGARRTTDADRAAVLAALDRVGCADLAGRSVHALSGGERQRVLIARALAQECDHLVLDEPTNHLDVRFQVEVLEVVAGLGVTVLAALHDLSLAGLWCDTVHLLGAGRLVASGTPAEVITVERVRETYGAQVLVVEHPETGTPHLIPRRGAVPGRPSPSDPPHPPHPEGPR